MFIVRRIAAITAFRWRFFFTEFGDGFDGFGGESERRFVAVRGGDWLSRFTVSVSGDVLCGILADDFVFLSGGGGGFFGAFGGAAFFWGGFLGGSLRSILGKSSKLPMDKQSSSSSAKSSSSSSLAISFLPMSSR